MSASNAFPPSWLSNFQPEQPKFAHMSLRSLLSQWEAIALSTPLFSAEESESLIILVWSIAEQARSERAAP